MGIVIFDDNSWYNFVPLTYTRPVFDLKIGAFTPIERQGNDGLNLLVRNSLADITKERHPRCYVNSMQYDNDNLIMSSTFLALKSRFLELIQSRKKCILINSGIIIAANLGKEDFEYLFNRVTGNADIEINKLQAERIELDNTFLMSEASVYPWDIINNLEKNLTEQINSIPIDPIESLPKVQKIGKYPLKIKDNLMVEACSIFNTIRGPIYIGSNVNLQQCHLSGPLYIDNDAKIKAFAALNNSYIGKDCRVGGEIDSCIVSSFSNKAHNGYLGHSYVGEWVNLGANTTTSDLKMTYGKISINSNEGRRINTNMIKLGSFFGDMSKSSINTSIFGSTRIGVSSHMYGLVTKDVPSYVINGSGIGAKDVELEIDSAIETQRRMMSRRERTMTQAYVSMMRDVFDMTTSQRVDNGIKKEIFKI
jgi:UDP-N-acetylglucosamine diphosphorylase/glucosamine-1-phosphate N-acetyltransferase